MTIFRLILICLYLFSFVTSVCERDRNAVEDATSVEDCAKREFKPTATDHYKCCYYEAVNPDDYERGRGCWALTKEQYENKDEFQKELEEKLKMKFAEFECDVIETKTTNSNFLKLNLLLLILGFL